MSYILVATGVRREAATLDTFKQIVIPGGGDAVALRRKLDAAAGDAVGIISFGLGGALDGSLRIGDWVIGKHLTGSIDAACDSDWIEALRERHPHARVGTIYSDGCLISEPEEKAKLADQHGALVVDMESHVAASVAMAHGLPFAVLRCVSDEARHALPPAIAVAMRANGSVNGIAMLRSIFTTPQQLPALIGSVEGFRKAMRELKKRGKLISQPFRKTAQFSRVDVVSSGLEFSNNGRSGWGFSIQWNLGSSEPPYRQLLERLAGEVLASNLDLPPWEEGEDYIEGSFDWRGNYVRIYYETQLDFMTLWSLDRGTIADLREEIIRLASPSV